MDREGQATYPTAPGTSLSLPVTPIAVLTRMTIVHKGPIWPNYEQEALMLESREKTLLALHRLGEGFINPPQEGKGGCCGARGGLLGASTMTHKEASGLPSHRLEIHHLLPSGSPTGAAALMTQFALIS